jgi:hypothetical protein
VKGAIVAVSGLLIDDRAILQRGKRFLGEPRKRPEKQQE